VGRECPYRYYVRYILWLGAGLRLMRRNAFLAIVFLAAFGLLLFWRVLVAGEVFFWHDVTVAYMPLRKLAQDAIQHGFLPLWTQKIGCGFPLLAEGQSATFYPLHLIAYLGLPYYHTYSLMVYLHCLLGAIFAALLGRKLRLGWAAAALAGLVYGFSGYFVSKVLFITVLESGAWLPLILYLVISGLESGNSRYFIGGAVALCLSILGGHPQIVFYEILAAIALIFAYLLGRRPQPLGTRLVRSFSGAILVFGLGVGLAALQLLPTAALAQFADRRAEVTAADLRSLGMSAHNLAYYVHPTVFGSYAENNYFGHDHYYEVCGYAGGLTLILALLALTGREPMPKYRWYFVFLVVFGLFMALAKYNPLYELLPGVPGFNFFRAPGRYVLLTTLGLALLAGGGLQSLAGSARKLQARRLAQLCILVLVVAGVAMIALNTNLLRSRALPVLRGQIAASYADAGAHHDEISQKAQDKYTFFVNRLSLADPNWRALVVGSALVGTAALLLALGLGGYRTVAAASVVVLGWQLLTFGLPYNGTAPASFYTDPPRTAQLIHADANPGRQYTDPRLYSLDFTAPEYPGWAEGGDVQPYVEAREILHANSAVLYDIDAIEGYRYALLPSRQYELFEKYIPDGLAGKPGGAQPIQLLRMLNVRYFIGWPEPEDYCFTVGGLDVDQFEVAYSDARFTMYRLKRTMPLAWLAKGLTYCGSSEEVRDFILEYHFDPSLETAVESRQEDLVSSPDEGRITSIVEPRGMTVEAQVPPIVGGERANSAQSEQKIGAGAGMALLVLSIAYHPNLVARVDGKTAPIYRTNYILCGVPVPRGEHIVTVRYESKPLRWGLVISFVSALVTLILLAAMSRHKRRQEAVDGA